MNNELERILGEVAEGASRRAGSLPVDSLRDRGVRRRRARHTGFAAVGVAAAFGLVLGTVQLLPDLDSPRPAATELPTGDLSLPLGACGSVISSMPTVDASMSLDMGPLSLAAKQGEALDLTMTMFQHGPGDLEWEREPVPVLLVLRDDVVVGWSWPEDAVVPSVPAGESGHVSGFGPAVVCEQGELVPGGTADDAAPLPEGTYQTYGVLSTLEDDPEVGLTVFPGPGGTLRMGETNAVMRDASVYRAEDVDLPACGEPIAGYEFPDETIRDARNTLRVSEESDTAVLRAQAGWTNAQVDDAIIRADDFAGVIARDGVVVTYVRSGSLGDGPWLAGGEDVPLDVTWYWLDCETFDEIFLPVGEYELLAMRLVTVQEPDGSRRVITIGYDPVPFALTATSDREASVAPAVELPVCAEPTAGFSFPAGVDDGPAPEVRVQPTHTGTDELGDEEQFFEGYGDQLEVEGEYTDRTGEAVSVTPVDGGAVVVHDGVVVAELSWDGQHGFAVGRAGDRGPFIVGGVHNWIDCATGEHVQVPKGEYQLLGWQRLDWWGPDGRKVTRTHVLGPTAFTAYDFEDPDNPGPGTD